jgi:hypothetical protein
MRLCGCGTGGLSEADGIVGSVLADGLRHFRGHSLRQKMPTDAPYDKDAQTEVQDTGTVWEE